MEMEDYVLRFYILFQFFPSVLVIRWRTGEIPLRIESYTLTSKYIASRVFSMK